MKPNPTLTPETALLFVLARSSARRNYAPDPEWDDYAMEFIKDVLDKNAQPHITATPHSIGYWRQTADNWMKNALRDNRRRRRGEVAWPQTEDEVGQTIAFDPQDGHSGPAGAALQEELRGLLEKAMEKLTPQQQAFLVRHVVNGRPTKPSRQKQAKRPMPFAYV